MNVFCDARLVNLVTKVNDFKNGQPLGFKTIVVLIAFVLGVWFLRDLPGWFRLTVSLTLAFICLYLYDFFFYLYTAACV